jgi:hypothetical protein
MLLAMTPATTAATDYAAAITRSAV